MGMDRLTEQVDKEARDLQIFAAVIEHGPIGIVRLSEETEIPEHKVRYSLRMLENDGLIEPTPQGAIAVEDVDEVVTELNEGLDRLVERLEDIKEITPQRVAE